jgi:hypothetical protein
MSCAVWLLSQLKGDLDAIILKSLARLPVTQLGVAAEHMVKMCLLGPALPEIMELPHPMEELQRQSSLKPWLRNLKTRWFKPRITHIPDRKTIASIP